RLPLRPVQLQLIDGPNDVLDQVHGHYLAVSTTVLYGGYNQVEAHRRAVEFLRSCRPVARTTTFFIYDFTRQGDRTGRSEPFGAIWSQAWFPSWSPPRRPSPQSPASRPGICLLDLGSTVEASGSPRGFSVDKAPRLRRPPPFGGRAAQPQFPAGL